MAPVEKLAYVAALNANGGNQSDALVVVDVGRVDMPNVEMNFIISAGTRAVQCCVPMLRACT